MFCVQIIITNIERSLAGTEFSRMFSFEKYSKLYNRILAWEYLIASLQNRTNIIDSKLNLSVYYAAS